MSNTIHPAGTYAAKVLESGLSTTKTGKDQISVRFRTEHGEVTGFFFLTEKAIEYSFKKLSAMGFAADSLADLNNGAIDGNTCLIEVKHEEYNGVVRAKVDGVYKEGEEPGVRKDATAANNAKRFDGLWKKVREDSEAVPFLLSLALLSGFFIA